MNKTEELAAIAQEIERCTECKVGKSGQAVPGEGNANANIVLLGSVAAQAVLDKKVSILKDHGEVVKKNRRIYFLTLHPAAALRMQKFFCHALRQLVASTSSFLVSKREISPW